MIKRRPTRLGAPASLRVVSAVASIAIRNVPCGVVSINGARWAPTRYETVIKVLITRPRRRGD